MAVTPEVTAKLALGEYKRDTVSKEDRDQPPHPTLWVSTSPKDIKNSDNANPMACKTVNGEYDIVPALEPVYLVTAKPPWLIKSHTCSARAVTPVTKQAIARKNFEN